MDAPSPTPIWSAESAGPRYRVEMEIYGVRPP